MKALIVLYIAGFGYVFGSGRESDAQAGRGDREIGWNLLVALIWPLVLIVGIAELVFTGKSLKL